VYIMHGDRDNSYCQRDGPGSLRQAQLQAKDENDKKIGLRALMDTVPKEFWRRRDVSFVCIGRRSEHG
jgi:hypothetical protein